MRHLTGGPGYVQYLLWKVDASHEGGLAAARVARRLHAGRILISTMKPFVDVHRRCNELAPAFLEIHPPQRLRNVLFLHELCETGDRILMQTINSMLGMIDGINKCVCVGHLPGQNAHSLFIGFANSICQNGVPG